MRHRPLNPIMPNCDFYAAREDNKALLELLFLNGGCRVYESYSHMDAELVEFSSMSDLERHCGLAQTFAGINSAPDSSYERRPRDRRTHCSRSRQVQWRHVSLLRKWLGAGAIAPRSRTRGQNARVELEP